MSKAGMVVPRRRKRPVRKYSIFAFIEDGVGRILAFKDTKPESSKTFNRMVLPGGKKKNIEQTLLATLQREVKEETGLDIILESHFLWVGCQKPKKAGKGPEVEEIKIFVHAKVTGGIRHPHSGRGYTEMDFYPHDALLTRDDGLVLWYREALEAFREHKRMPQAKAPSLPAFDSALKPANVLSYGPTPVEYRI